MSAPEVGGGERSAEIDALAVAIERLVEAVGDSLDSRPSNAAAVLVNTGDLRLLLRALAAGGDPPSVPHGKAWEDRLNIICLCGKVCSGVIRKNPASGFIGRPGSDAYVDPPAAQVFANHLWEMSHKPSTTPAKSLLHDRGCAAEVTNGAARCQCTTSPEQGQRP